MNKSWYSKRILAFFITTIITVIMIFSAIQIEIGESKDSKYTVFSVIFEYYGMDSKQIEELITIPLEEKLMPLSGLQELKSSVEYNKSTTSAYFKKTVDDKKVYLSIRNIVDTLYKLLPSDVQKPRIISSAAEDKAVLSIAFTGAASNINTRNWLEKNMKKKLEAIDGVSEVVIAGGNIEEVIVDVDVEKMNSIGQKTSALSIIVQDSNSINPGSEIKKPNLNEKISFNTQLQSIHEMNQIPLKVEQGFTHLGYFADIDKKPRVNDEIVRINGEECVIVGLKSSSNGNNILISKECRNLLEEQNFPEDTWKILYDSGEDLQKIIHQVFIAMLSSLIGICLLIPFFFNKIKAFFLAIAFLFTSGIWTVGILQLFGFTLNQNTLAGITIAFGLIADAMFIINETAFSSSSLESYIVQVKRLIPSIVSASLTTLLVLIPLIFMDSLVPGTKNITVTIGIMLLVSVIITIIFYPCFIDHEINNSHNILPNRLYKAINRTYIRNTYRGILLCKRHKAISIILYSLMFIVPIISFFTLGKNLTLKSKADIIYATIEFEPEYNAEYVDRTISPFVSQVQQLPQIKFIRSDAKKGTAELEIGFDEKLISKKELANILYSYEPYVSSGFLYIPGLTGKEDKSKVVEVAIVGDDTKKCMNYVKTATQYLSQSGLYTSIVLNFKNPEKIINFTPSKDLLLNLGLDVETVAAEIRWLLFGPVADKWIEDGVETDIRIRGEGLQNASQSTVKNIFINYEEGSIKLDALGTFEEAEGQGKIFRKDGRRAAYFTVEADYASLDQILEDLRLILDNVPLEKGYGFSFPKEMEAMNKNYAILAALLILCVLGIIILLTALTEKIRQSLIISSIIPVSLFLPILIYTITGKALEFGDIIGMVILSGISVNNAIYIVESKSQSCVFKLRNKVSSILITSLTSIVGAVPLLIFTTDAFSKSMSFFMIWGILNSLIISLTLFPILVDKKKKRKLTKL